MYKWNPIRPKGKTKLRWVDDIVNCPKIMKVNNWIRCILNRKIWNENVVEKTKTFNEVKFINNKHLFIFALSLFTKHCNPLVDTILH